MKRKIDTIDLSRASITELKKLGYHICKDLQINRELCGKFKIDSDTLLKRPTSKSAFELYQEEIINGCVFSYNKQLDELLLNVVAPKTITELTGLSGSGKTQISFQLCTSVQLPEWCGGLNGEVIFFSTNRNFAPDRLREFAHNFVSQYKTAVVNMKMENKNFNEETIMKRIHYKKITDVAELMACLKQLEMFLLDKNIKLLVIDSISYPLRLLEVKNRIIIISQIFQIIRELANKFNFAVVITNDLTIRTDEDNSFTTPSFGDSFYHLVNSRIVLSKQGSMFNGKLVKSTHHTQKEVNF